MEQVLLGLDLVLLLLVANGGPVVATYFLHEFGSWPLDGGLKFFDGRRLLGASKTWRGLFTAVVLSAVTARMLGYTVEIGALFGLLAMLGDALASFCKRRLGLAPSARATGLDQIPEAVLPMWVMHEVLGITLSVGIAITTVFVLLEIVLSKLLYLWHIRQQPY